MGAMESVLVVGEALIDVVVPATGAAPAEHVGGSPANVAVGLARLGHRTELATWIADDARGRRIQHLLAAEGVALTAGSRGAARTSTAIARLDALGVAAYEFDLDWRADPALRAAPGGHLHTGSIAATLEPGGSDVTAILRGSREHATISYDPNARPGIMGRPQDVAPRVEEIVALSDVVKASAEDVDWLYGATPAGAVERWSALGPRLILVTLGEGGVLVAVGAERAVVPARPVSVADTVGAGDSFMSGLLSGLLDRGLLGGPAGRARLAGASLADVAGAVERALACAAITVSRAGANPPRRDELAPPA